MSIRFCDISNLGKLRLSGGSSHDFVRAMFSSDLTAVKRIGGVEPSLLLNGEAEIIDLVMLIRTGGDEYMITTSPSNSDEVFAWLQAHGQISDDQGKVFEDLELSDESNSLADIVLFGKGASAVIEELSGIDLQSAPHEAALSMVQLDTVPILLLKTPVLKGYSLEAYEMLFAPASKRGVINALMSFAQIDPMKTDEYISLRKSLKTWFECLEDAAYLHPDEAGLTHLVRADMDYVGAKALAERLK